jgi:superfamily II DNA helicase RecQ
MFSLNQFFHAIKYALRVTNYENIFLKVKQYQVVESVLLKKDTIGILATGYGKSVIFHLIPFAADYLYKNFNGRNIQNGNIILIITPLNAIIDDQISILKKHGIKATVLRADTITAMTKESDTEEIEGEIETVSGGNFEENTTLRDLKLDDKTKVSIQEGKFKIIYSHPEAFVSCKEGRRFLMSSVLQKKFLHAYLTKLILSKNGE